MGLNAVMTKILPLDIIEHTRVIKVKGIKTITQADWGPCSPKKCSYSAHCVKYAHTMILWIWY